MQITSQNHKLILNENPNKVLTSLLCGIILVTTEMKRNFAASDYERIALDKLQLYAQKLICYDSDELLSIWIGDFIKHCDKTINFIQLNSNANAEILREVTRDIRLFNAMINELIT